MTPGWVLGPDPAPVVMQKIGASGAWEVLWWKRRAALVSWSWIEQCGGVHWLTGQSVGVCRVSGQTCRSSRMRVSLVCDSCTVGARPVYVPASPLATAAARAARACTRRAICRAPPPGCVYQRRHRVCHEAQSSVAKQLMRYQCATPRHACDAASSDDYSRSRASRRHRQPAPSHGAQFTAAGAGAANTPPYAQFIALHFCIRQCAQPKSAARQVLMLLDMLRCTAMPGAA